MGGGGGGSFGPIGKSYPSIQNWTLEVPDSDESSESLSGLKDSLGYV